MWLAACPYTQTDTLTRMDCLRCTCAMQAFEFDRVFGPESTQEQIFTDVAQLVTSALDGYNVCIFAYGQTGACYVSKTPIVSHCRDL